MYSFQICSRKFHTGHIIFFLKRKYLKDGGHKSDSVMFISVCLFFNFASIIQIIPEFGISLE